MATTSGFLSIDDPARLGYLPYEDLAVGRIGILTLVGGLLAATPASGDLFGPTPYLSQADTPAAFTGGATLTLEDFEDGVLDQSGVEASPVTAHVFGPGRGSDSVDGDDGMIDGSGTGGPDAGKQTVSHLGRIGRIAVEIVAQHPVLDRGPPKNRGDQQHADCSRAPGAQRQPGADEEKRRRGRRPCRRR
jgi:hypothetical protein